MAIFCRWALLLLLLAVWVGGCEKQGSDSGSEDARYSSVTPPRICVLSPAISRMLVDLKLESHIVGRHRWDQILPRSVPAVGDQLDIDYELLLQLRPDDVILQLGDQPLPVRLQQLARDQGWNVRSYDIDTIDDVQRVLLELPHELAFSDDAEGILLREQTIARSLKLYEEINRKLQPVRVVEDAGETLLLFNTDPLSAFGPESFMGELYALLGGSNVLQQGDYPQLSLEDVIAISPETVILFEARDNAETTSEGNRDRKNINNLGALARVDIPALRDDRIFFVRDKAALLPSTSIVAIADQIVRSLNSREHHTPSAESGGNGGAEG